VAVTERPDRSIVEVGIGAAAVLLVEVSRQTVAPMALRRSARCGVPSGATR
jgi:hypothetical protein